MLVFNDNYLRLFVLISMQQTSWKNSDTKNVYVLHIEFRCGVKLRPAIFGCFTVCLDKKNIAILDNTTSLHVAYLKVI